MLPLNDINTDNSPFSPISAFALNPLFISLTKLPYVDKQTEEMKKIVTELKDQNKADRIDWVLRMYSPASSIRSLLTSYTVRTLKENWLSLYVALPESQQVLKSEAYSKFLKDSAYWIESYALFRALKKKNDRKFWGDWPETQTMDKEAAAGKMKSIMETPTYKKLLKEYATDITFYSFLQMLSANQLTQAKDYANGKKVWFKGDVPFLCSKDSSDVWYVEHFTCQVNILMSHRIHRDLFLQDFAAGAPPDMYSKDGQDWGLPLYNWPEMEKAEYRWWKVFTYLASPSSFQ